MTKRSSAKAANYPEGEAHAAPSAALAARFEIVRELGRGGMGTVFEAIDRRTGEHLAVKTLQRFDGESLYRFKREFRALADISHPNLVALYELYSADDGWFFTMERVDGVGLLQWLIDAEATRGVQALRRSASVPRAVAPIAQPEKATGRNVPRRSASGWMPAAKSSVPAEGAVRNAFAQLARALLALHEAGRIHRDIKPSNVMITHAGKVVVLDFGIVAELGSTRLDDASIVGTPGYMAPEQALQGTPPTPASDWYAFGVVLYEALAGRRPFVGSTTQVLAAKLAVAPPSLADLAPNAPRDLVALCAELLAIEPTQRPGGLDVLSRLCGDESPISVAGVRDQRAEGPLLVGRDGDLAVLEAALARARQRPEGLLVSAPAGHGKTALVEAFLWRAEQRPEVLVLRGRCYERESVPYKGLDSLVDALCRDLLEPGRPLARLLPDDAGALAAAFPVLRRVPAIAARRPQQVDASETLKARAMRALLELLKALARARAIILFIDDLQWGDSDSAAMLLDLLASHDARESERDEGTSKGIFFVGTFRSVYRAKSALLDALLAAAVDGSARLREHALTAVPKTSLHAVTRPRLAILSGDARRLLEVLAVAGAPLRKSVALRVAETPAAARRPLAQLERAGFIRSDDDGEDPHLEPTHAAVAESLVVELTPERRRTIHLALAQTIEARRDATDVHALARHYHQAWPMAESCSVIAACEEAARSAEASFAFDVAFVHLQHAREVAVGCGTVLGSVFDHRLGEAAARTGHIAVAVQSLRRSLEQCPAGVPRAQLRLELSKLLLAQLDPSSAGHQAAEGFRELRVSPSTSVLLALLVCLAALAAHGVRSRLGISRAPLAPAHRDELRVRAALFVQSAATSWFRIDRRGQLVTLLRLVPLALRLGDGRELAHARCAAAIMTAAAGLRDIPMRLLQEADESLRHARDPQAVARAAQYRAHVANVLGDPCASVHRMQLCLDAGGHTLENLDYLMAVADAAGNLLLRGHAAEGLRWVGLGVARATIDGESNRLAWGHSYRCHEGPLLALLGRATEARRAIDEVGATLGHCTDDRWRRGQWLAHQAMLFAELGGDLAAFEQTVRDFHALGLSPGVMPLQLRHFYVAQAMVRLAALDGTRGRERLWQSSRAELARAAATHPTHRAHLRALEAAYLAWRGEDDAAREALEEAAELARAHDNVLVLWDVCRQRALQCARDGDALGARRENETADAIAVAQGWALRRVRLLTAVKRDVTDPRWPYGGAPRDPLEPGGICL